MVWVMKEAEDSDPSNMISDDEREMRKIWKEGREKRRGSLLLLLLIVFTYSIQWRRLDSIYVSCILRGKRHYCILLLAEEEGGMMPFGGNTYHYSSLGERRET